MSQLVQNDPLLKRAQLEWERFLGDAKARDKARRRRLWRIDYFSIVREAWETREVKVQIKSIIRLLKRLHGSVPESLEKKIRAIMSLQLLDQLFDLTIDRVSLEEIEKNIPSYLLDYMDI